MIAARRKIEWARCVYCHKRVEIMRTPWGEHIGQKRHKVGGWASKFCRGSGT